MSFILFDSKVLIKEVRNRPCIWNHQHQDYNDKEAKENAWFEIGAIIFPNIWDTYSLDLKVLKKQQLIKKWRNIKDSYTKDLKSNMGRTPPVRRRKYIYANLLSFLKYADKGSGSNGKEYKSEDASDTDSFTSSSYNNNSTNNNYYYNNQSNSLMELGLDFRSRNSAKDFHNVDPSNIQEENNMVNNMQSEESFIRLKQDHSTNMFEEIQVQYDPDLDAPTDICNTSSVLEDKISNLAAMVEKQNDLALLDEDKTFVMSLIPTFKKMTGLQKLNCKMQILNVIKSIMYPEAQASPQCTTSTPNNIKDHSSSFIHNLTN